jgi:hypothetical protein
MGSSFAIQVGPVAVKPQPKAGSRSKWPGLAAPTNQYRAARKGDRPARILRTAKVEQARVNSHPRSCRDYQRPGIGNYCSGFSMSFLSCMRGPFKNILSFKQNTVEGS